MFSPPVAFSQVINEDVKVLPNDGSEDDTFGWSISIENDIVAVGAIYAIGNNGERSGVAYLFDVDSGSQIAKFFPEDGAPSDDFGNSIALANGFVAVGSPFDAGDDFSRSGSVYLFSASTGGQVARFFPSDPYAGQYFGFAVAMHNGIVAIGSPEDNDNGLGSGSAYLFTTSGTQQFKLLPSDGVAQDQFGSAIAIHNGIVVVGSGGDDDNGDQSGSVYLFDASTGNEIAKLLPNIGFLDAGFGYSVAIENDLVAVGSFHYNGPNALTGAVYLFDISTGAQVAKLLPPAGAMGSGFGSSVSIYNGFVLIGAGSSNDNGAASGSAYLYDAYTCDLVAQFLPTDGTANDLFGSAVSFANGRIAVGAYRDDPNGPFSGSAYVFTAPNVTTPADLNGDGLVDFFDMQIFLDWYSAGDLRADFVPDGVLDFFDLQAYLNLFALGCV